MVGMITIKKHDILRAFIILSMCYICMLYIIFPLIFFNLSSVKETGILYRIIRICCMPSTFILALVAVFILIYDLKKNTNEKHGRLVLICVIFGILAVLGYCGIMLGSCQ
jgi:ABC-type transport system involved in cytochrome c biogenesis permease subunit